MGGLIIDDDGRRGEEDGPRPEDDGPCPLGIRVFKLSDIGKVRKGYRLFYV